MRYGVPGETDTIGCTPTYSESIECMIMRVVHTRRKVTIGDIGAFVTYRPMFHPAEPHENTLLHDNAGNEIAFRRPTPAMVSMECYTIADDGSIDALRELLDNRELIKISGIADCVPMCCASYRMIWLTHRSHVGKILEYEDNAMFYTLPSPTGIVHIDKVVLTFEVMVEWS